MLRFLQGFRTRRATAAKYTPLLGEDDKNEWSQGQAQQPVANWILYVIFAACIAATAVNTFLVAKLYSKLNPAEREAQAPLPRLNQFIGLDKVNRSHDGYTPPNPFHIPPLLLTQVNSEKEEFVYPDDPRRWYSIIGTVSPDDRQFIVNKTTSTIAQFRTLDFGMELCELYINVSSSEVLASEKNKLHPFNRTFSLSPRETVSIDVYSLQADRPLDLPTLSWRTKPPRTTLAYQLTISHDTTARTQQFPCKSDSLHSFEFVLSESSGECAVEWWQDEHDTLGIFVMQYPTT